MPRVAVTAHWIGQLYFRLASWAVFTVRNGLDHPI
jgi:hypothetical protein